MHLYTSRVISKVAWYSTVEPKILYLESKGELHCMTLDCHLSKTREKRSDFSNCVLIQLLWWRLKTLRTGTRNQFSLCLNFPPRPFSLLLHPYKTHATKRNSRPSKRQRNSVHLAPKPPASTQGGELLPWNPKVKETAITLLFSTSKLTSPPTTNLNRVLVFLFD